MSADPMPDTAEELARRVRSGDRAALERLLRLLAPRLRGWLGRLLGPRAELDDATQELLIELARALPRFEGRSALSTYCHRIAVRVASRHFGRAGREAPLELLPPPPESVDPESRAMDRQLLERLYHVLDGIAPARRVAFVLCAVEGFTPTEAAAIEGIRAATMRVRLHRARRDVEAALADDPYVRRLEEGRES
ncbi:MAG TPA: RNA polymerase sigma factor [Sandaracinaceae bacterium LLY-WYZ-13_1]|nr:RNA polymerase sigma factor [Sandaracinaceae bacterium LLY-WYZ-13_1]